MVFACGAALAALWTFAPGVAPAEQNFLLLKLDGAFVKWGGPTLGTGARVTYAFVREPIQFSDARNCEAMRPLEPALARQEISPAALRAEAAAAFAMWEQVADIGFREVADPNEADILIGAQAVPRGRAFANVEYDRSSTATTRPIELALICLSPDQPWKIGFGGNNAAYDLRYTIAHEIGHAIGLNHPGPQGQLMGFQYSENSRALQPGDIEGAVTLYGSRDKTRRATVPENGVADRSEMGLR
jgi:hypothetical protein